MNARHRLSKHALAAPGFSRDLKIATGKSRNEWAALF